MEACQVCEKPSKYKCPQCAIRFCSLDCFKKHKAEGALAAYSCDIIRNMQGKQVSFEKREEVQEQRHNNSELILDETDVIVPEERIARAAQSNKIRAYMGHSKLKAIIREIDGANSYRKKAMLRKRMSTDIDFRVFIDDLLKEMGYMNEAGQFEVKPEEVPSVKLVVPLEETTSEVDEQ